MRKFILLVGTMATLTLTNVSVAKDDISICKNSNIWYQGRVTSFDEGDAAFLGIKIKNKGKTITIDAGCDSEKCNDEILNKKVRVKLYTTSMEEGMDKVCYIKEIDELASQSNDQEENLFYCRTKNNKQVSLLRKGGDIFYTFGKDLKNPEITLRKKPYEVITHYEMLPGGRAQIITIENGRYTYDLRAGNRSVCSNDECSERIPMDVGDITVYRNTKILAEIECDASTITSE